MVYNIFIMLNRKDGIVIKYNLDSKLRKNVLYNIKYYREKANITQEELSIKIGRKNNFIEKLENGETKLEPTLITIDQIAKKLNIPTEYLVKERKF